MNNPKNNNERNMLFPPRTKQMRRRRGHSKQALQRQQGTSQREVVLGNARTPEDMSSTFVEGGTYVFKNGNWVLIEPPAIRTTANDLSLSAGSMYRSRDGRKIQIFAINPNSKEFPVVGMIELEGVWRPMVWDTTGIVKRPYGSPNDIVEPWSNT